MSRIKCSDLRTVLPERSRLSSPLGKVGHRKVESPDLKGGMEVEESLK